MTSAVTIPRHGGTGGRTAVAARARQVVKAYGSGETRVVALDHVDVDIARGQFTAIMGPSGSGKSTLMHCLAGLDTVTSGEIFLDETEITKLKDKKLTQLRRDRIGFIFQAFNLLPTLNRAREHHAAHGHRGPQARRRSGCARSWRPSGSRSASSTAPPSSPAASSSAWRSPGRSPPSRTSSSVTSPPEISTPGPGAEVLSFLRRSVDELGQTIVMVTHDPVAASYADRVLYLADGSIVDEMYDPTADQVLDRMKHFDARGRTS